METGKEQRAMNEIVLLKLGEVVLKGLNREPLISNVFSFREFPDAFTYIEHNSDTSLKVMIKM